VSFRPLRFDFGCLGKFFRGVGMLSLLREEKTHVVVGTIVVLHRVGGMVKKRQAVAPVLNLLISDGNERQQYNDGGDFEGVWRQMIFCGEFKCGVSEDDK